MTEDENEWTNCPECGKDIKAKNFSRHLQRAHNMSASEAKTKVEDFEKARRDSGSGIPRNAIIAAGIVIILILAIVAAVLLIPGDEENDENGDNGIPSDPNRVEFTTDDGFKMVGSFYPAKKDVIAAGANDRPTLICVHGMNEKRSVWNDRGLVDDALNWGFNVLTYDIRGHGESIYKNGKKYDVNSFTETDFINMPEDVHAAVAFITSSYATNGQMAIIGASIGANAAVSAAWNEPGIRSLVLLSPSLNYQGITTYDPVYDYRQRDLFITAGSNELDIKDDCEDLANRAEQRDRETGDVRTIKLEFYAHSNPEEFLHGTNLFKVDKFQTDLEQWLKDTMIDTIG
jgi:pimeloyl-ACP methyl ester carboxylesterase